MEACKKNTVNIKRSINIEIFAMEEKFAIASDNNLTPIT